MWNLFKVSNTGVFIVNFEQISLTPYSGAFIVDFEQADFDWINASIFEPHLKVFPTATPIVPFMYKEMEKILRRLLGLIYRKEALSEKIQNILKMKRRFLLNCQLAIKTAILNLVEIKQQVWNTIW